MENKKTVNLHANHRERMRAKAVSGGIKFFNDHELLEILLYYGIPYKDTNLLAHELLAKYGSLEAVFNAELLDLKAFYNMTEIEAVNLAVTGEIFRRIKEGKRQQPVYINSSSDAAQIARILLSDKVKEEVVLICLAPDNKAVFKDVICKGSFSKVNIIPRDIVQIVLRQNANKIILCHNHPSNNCKPSQEDIELTEYLTDGLSMCEIDLIEHLIVSKESVYSMRLDMMIEGGAANEFYNKVNMVKLRDILADSKAKFK